MQNDMIDIMARLAIQEYLLEIFHANLFSDQQNPTEALAIFRKDILDRVRFKSYSEDSDETILLIQQRSIEIAELFFDKVSDRMDDFPK